MFSVSAGRLTRARYGSGYHQRDMLLLLWHGFEFWKLLKVTWIMLGKCGGWCGWTVVFGVRCK